ncbi:hypothetical protein ACHAWT_000262 [Skeletonema menzelii]|mmetsp:Transcript_17852/g.29233  ORF Transcript_17852/g.29233 Transcript_17852/m.29233 type:complete len:154 (+) Transcript_17852:59-520(+)|eukprot:scaffold19399_cov133-Skeletonema_menzelii.AAC.3
MNDNQNAFVTRSTSRVLSVPGGKSSVGFLFGGGAAKAPAPAAAEKTADTEKEVLANVVAAEEEKGGATDSKATTAANYVAPVNDAMSEAARIKKKNESQHFSIFGTVNDTQAPKESSNAFASAATTNSYNVLTDRPTSRVLRPPGGQSSIKLG